MTRTAKTLMAVLIATMVAMTMFVSKKEKGQHEKTVISIGLSGNFESTEEKKKEFMRKYPNILIENANLSSVLYTSDISMQNLDIEEIPTVFSTVFSEVSSFTNLGYATDITDTMIKYGYVDAMNPVLLEAMTDDFGRIYGVPVSAYAQGLYINKKLFIQAGLVDENGNVRIPDTYEEVADFSQIIKEKTGASGFVIPNTGKFGGWHLMNIAWSNGVEFVKKTKDGTWKACFDTPEFLSTLEWLYDMKWRKKALSDEMNIDNSTTYSLFASNQAAMMFANPPMGVLVSQFNMDKSDIFVAKMPKGSVNRVTQMGGDLYMIKAEATEEQVDAVFKWLEFNGLAPVCNDTQMNLEKEQIRQTYESGGIVLPQDVFDLWVTPERIQKSKEIKKEFVNVNLKDYESFLGFEGVTIRKEVPVCCQELYAILDDVIQAVCTDVDVNISLIIKEAERRWQVDYLDKLNENIQ